MEHIKKEELLKYKSGYVSLNRAQEIEDHIYSCDICLNNYLKLIDTKVISINKKQLRNFMYKYTIAASIVVMITSTGIFNKVININDKIEDISYRTNNMENIVYKINDRLTNSLSFYINKELVLERGYNDEK